MLFACTPSFICAMVSPMSLITGSHFSAERVFPAARMSMLARHEEASANRAKT